jgi:hypothetical protein
VDPNDDQQCTDTDKDSRCDTENGQIVRTISSNSESITIRGNYWVRKVVRFDLSGYSGWNNGSFSVCSRNKQAPEVGIVIAPSGRVRMSADNDHIHCSNSYELSAGQDTRNSRGREKATFSSRPLMFSGAAAPHWRRRSTTD